MFPIVCDPSSGSMELYLTEITRSGSLIFVVCLVGVWQRNFEPVVCVCVCVCVRYDRLQLQRHTPWWWITYDPKHVAVIFNFVSFKLLYDVDFNL